MFLPKTSDAAAEEEKAKADRRAAYERIELWSKEAVPADIRGAVNISVQEVQCGDPMCAPIDTAVAIMFTGGERGMMGIPSEAKDVSKEMLLDSFPTEDVLRKWSRGEEADWPPFDDEEFDEEFQRPRLRFDVGQRVECRISPDPVTGWAPGAITLLWYREPNWPPESWAPYQIRLDDGRLIFAPGDIDQIIRAERLAPQDERGSQGGGVAAKKA